MNGTIEVNVDLVNASSDSQLPSLSDFRTWAESALSALPRQQAQACSTELSIRIVDEEESAHLNRHYRHRTGPTNILSFPCSAFEGTGISLLGDLAICAPLVRQEAQEQAKTVKAHWAHLAVHGILHLSGYDHEEQAAAEEMEALEITILDSLGYRNPYSQDMQGNE